MKVNGFETTKVVIYTNDFGEEFYQADIFLTKDEAKTCWEKILETRVLQIDGYLDTNIGKSGFAIPMYGNFGMTLFSENPILKCESYVPK